MNELIAALKAIEANDDIVCPESGYLTDGDNPLVEETSYMAAGELITNSGGCNWQAHRALAAAGFPVHCGERDSFGWLSGVIRTAKGGVVYG